MGMLTDFYEKHGRSPRILHIGNIANNAYNNAKLLNEAGFDCDVICYDYYHIMGCPEWEDADLLSKEFDQFKPNWADIGVANFARPRWFAQGPLIEAVAYLIAKRAGDEVASEARWNKLKDFNGYNKKTTRFGSWFPRVGPIFSKVVHSLNIFATGKGVASYAITCDLGYVAKRSNSELVRMIGCWFLLTFSLMVRAAYLPVRVIRKIGRALNRLRTQKSDDLDSLSLNRRALELIEFFGTAFPSATETLSRSEFMAYDQVVPHWKRLFEHYDVIQAYATDPIIPMLVGTKPYIGFEHGTLRSHTNLALSIGRLTSLGYRLADHVLITNGDCIDFGIRIGLSSFSPMLHPINERRINAIDGDYEGLHIELGVKYIFICTLRHDWEIKGTDKYIRALPELSRRLKFSFKVIMTTWGEDLQKSKSLASELGVVHLIVWSEPLPRRRLIKTLKSVDILFDQLALPHFGATAPEGIAVGLPVIMSYDPISTEWLIPEAAPILSAKTTDDIVLAVLKALDPLWLVEYKKQSKSWYDNFHSSEILLKQHAQVYEKIFKMRNLI